MCDGGAKPNINNHRSVLPPSTALSAQDSPVIRNEFPSISNIFPFCLRTY